MNRDEELLNECKKYRELVEHQNDLIVKFDADWNLQFASPNYFKTFDISEKELLRKKFMPLIHKDDRERVKQSLRTLSSPPYTTEHEERVKTPVGWRWYAWSAKAILGENGEVDSIISVGRDITEAKRIEEQLSRSEEKYRTLFDEAIDGIAIADTETGIITDCNKALAEMVERDKDDIIGKPQTLLHPPEQVKEGFSDTFEKHRKEHQGEAIETKVITGRGIVKDVVIKANFVKVEEKTLLQGFFHDITERKRDERKLRELATTDGLTGILNRRAFLSGATKELTRSLRYTKPLSFLMVDIDLFKQVNDTYGHQAGDSALQTVTAVTKEMLRENDLFGRIGGEEFAVLLPETEGDYAETAAERLRQAIEKASFPTPSGDQTITVSIGISSLKGEPMEQRENEHRSGKTETLLERLMIQADDALYQAKREGRNRVIRL